VGYYVTGAGGQRTLAEHWDGKRWTIQTTPTGKAITQLNGVSCTSAKACLAVGEAYVSGTYRTLAERWNGKTWAITPTPDLIHGTDSYLEGVSCTSQTDCVAVGSYRHASTTVVLAEQWSGSHWVNRPAPDPAGSGGTSLTSVSCPAAGRCMAVGTQTQAGRTLALAEGLSGAHWHIRATAPIAGAQMSALSSVWCPTTSDCTAVGRDVDGSSFLGVLAEQYS
jgi:hypothetical protein